MGRPVTGPEQTSYCDGCFKLSGWEVEQVMGPTIESEGFCKGCRVGTGEGRWWQEFDLVNEIPDVECIRRVWRIHRLFCVLYAKSIHQVWPEESIAWRPVQVES